MTIEQTIAHLIETARVMHAAGRITARDLRDITIELEGNGSAIPGVRAFLASV